MYLFIKKTAVTSRLLSYLENCKTDVSDSNHVFVSIFTTFARKIVEIGTYLARCVNKGVQRRSALYCCAKLVEIANRQ